MSEASIVIEHLDYGYGEGALRRQILFDVNAVVRRGEIVILSGPSGSGKTTLLTLIGALRAAQVGSLRVLGRELAGATEETLTQVRREIGYVFQAHNLLGALTAAQNVELGMELHDTWSAEERRERADALLGQVGLEGFGDRYPDRISGGQRQRVAVARALAGEPSLLLADEPTASLDRKTGREVVSLIQQLARERGVTVVLVTHDSRILDVADRILALEDGRLSSFMNAVRQDTKHLWGVLAHDIGHGELVRRVRELEPEQFVAMLEQVTHETEELIAMIDLAQSDTFDSMLGQVLDAFAVKVGELLQSERSRVYLIEEDRAALFSVGFEDAESMREVRIAGARGVVGHAATRGAPIVLETAASEADYAAEADVGAPDDRLLAMPLIDAQGRAFAVIELSRPASARPFSSGELERLSELCAGLSTTIQTWFRMSCQCRSGKRIGQGSCCGTAHAPGEPCASHGTDS